MASSMKTTLFLLILSLWFLILVHARLDNTPVIDAIYQFGDSISDTGNLILEEPIGVHTPFARLPYGRTNLHKATGRCSDGLLMVDFIAKYFNLPYLDAYLNKGGNFTHGVNFAVAGSTALNTSTLAAKNITSPVTRSSLSVQLDWFNTHLQSICSSPSECKDKLANALFIVETGGNDFNYAIFARKPMEDVYQMVDEVVQAIVNATKEVIDRGAVRVVIPGNFPIGCMPIYLASFNSNDSTVYDDLHCLKGLNEFAKFQNERVKEAIRELQHEHPDVAIVYADYYSALRGLLQHATSLGFEKDGLQKTCCGKGNNEYNFDLMTMCSSETPVCEHPHKHVSWDGVHMTQHAYRVMTSYLLKQSIAPGIAHTV